MKERNTRALVGTPYEEHPQHCWRKGGAAVHKWVGLPLDVGQLWGRWGSRRVAVDYVPPPPPYQIQSSRGHAHRHGRSGIQKSNGKWSLLRIRSPQPSQSTSHGDTLLRWPLGPVVDRSGRESRRLRVVVL